ncbi:MAG TPA: hypothetical protein PLH39_03650, partial [Promineifilum sp.]|nr:hypothetical protein [Promineifilum sp.]
ASRLSASSLGNGRRLKPGLCQSRRATIDLTGGQPVVLWWQFQAWPPTGQVGAPGVTLAKPCD